MINYVLTIETGITDLVHAREFYQVTSFEQKKEELLALIFQKKKNKAFCQYEAHKKHQFFYQTFHHPLAITKPC